MKNSDLALGGAAILLACFGTTPLLTYFLLWPFGEALLYIRQLAVWQPI